MKNIFVILNVNENAKYIDYFTIMRFISNILLHSTLCIVCPKGCSIIFYDVENSVLNGASVSNAFEVLCYLKLC